MDVQSSANSPALPKKRKGERILFWLIAVILAVWFIYLAMDLSSASSWNRYKRQMAARGESLDFTNFIPKPTPDGQNFALAPIVVTSYAICLDTNGHPVIPQRTNIVDRLRMNIYGENDYSDLPTNYLTGRRMGKKSDLQAQQMYYRALAAKTNEFQIPATPQSPAQDVLLALSKYNADVEELRSAAQRPDSRFPLNYDADPPAMILLPHLAGLKLSGQMLALRELAELQNHQSDKALADIQLSFRLANSIRTEPFLISHLVRLAMLDLTLQPVWESLNDHQWSDAQLVELENDLKPFDFLADYEFSMRGERAMNIASIDYFRRTRRLNEFSSETEINPSDSSSVDDAGQILQKTVFHSIPGSLFYQNEITLAKDYQDWILPLANVQAQTISPEDAKRSLAAMNQQWAHFSFYTIAARMLLPSAQNALMRFAFEQSSVDMARVACALERYRLAHGGDYPETLDVLAPQFVDAVPHDIVNGQPLKYHRTDEGKYILYSVGWNETDEGGKTGLRDRTIYPDNRIGDWIWNGTGTTNQSFQDTSVW